MKNKYLIAMLLCMALLVLAPPDAWAQCVATEDLPKGLQGPANSVLHRVFEMLFGGDSLSGGFNNGPSGGFWCSF